MSKYRIYFVFSVFLFLHACFDYKEILVFQENFSGYVQLDYRVPMYPGKDRSLIAFLPVTKDRIKQRYARLLRTGQIRVENIRIRMQSVGLPEMERRRDEPRNIGEENSELFRRFAHVRYRLYFQNPLVLEEVLPGRVRIRQRGRNILQIERRYPVTGGLAEDANRIVSGMYRISRELLQDHSLEFQIRYADPLRLKSNRGSFQEDSSLIWKLPLESSLYEKENIVWNVFVSRAR